MIPVADKDVFNAGIAELGAFGAETNARGRFIALYLGLRRMRGDIAPLGSSAYTRTRLIEQEMDRMWMKTHVRPPRNVLTAPFGGSGTNGGYSAATGITAPGRKGPTNTWRNNLNSQKGVGCVADASLISELILHNDPRAACPYFALDGDQHYCQISKAHYRGEQHSIWLRRGEDGFQLADLDEPSLFEPYLRPSGQRIPVYALMAVLYGFAPAGVYPLRSQVSVEEFAADFGFEDPASVFDCDRTSPRNVAVLGALGALGTSKHPNAPRGALANDTAGPPTLNEDLPDLHDAILLNSGISGELAVARRLASAGWQVFYTGNQPLLGYDLRAESGTSALHVEVKSSTGYVQPVLTESEWSAALRLGSSYVLALVDFVGTEAPTVRFVTNPASSIIPTQRDTTTYRIPATAFGVLATDATPAPPS